MTEITLTTLKSLRDETNFGLYWKKINASVGKLEMEELLLPTSPLEDSPLFR